MSTTDLTHIENDWKKATNLGNTVVSDKVKASLYNYKEALKKAETLMKYHSKCIKLNIPVVDIFIISCNNLAEVYCLIKNWDKADKMIKRSIYYLEYLEKQDITNEFSVKYLKQLTKQMLYYKEFTERSRLPENYVELERYLIVNF